MTSPIAEQDSLERLIASLRDRANCAEDACRADGDDEVYRKGFEQLREAADTLCQMRDALEEARNFADYLDPCPAKYELIDMIDAALTTPKIEKE